MKKPHTIEDLYHYKFDWIPERLRREIGHFNVFTIEQFAGKTGKPIPFSRRDYYKISLIVGKASIHYADKTLHIDRQGLLFSNPQIPYNLERQDGKHNGFVCVFTPAFFHHFGNLNDYAVFQPGGTPVFELATRQVTQATGIFDRMFEELDSDYQHKYDALRNLVFELVHLAMKTQPAAASTHPDNNASHRVALLFLELLERQFPIEDTRQHVQLRTAADFARQLAIHVNYLNKAVRETTGKTTTDTISERLLRESKILLKNTGWNIAEIAYALGFNEVPNFNHFFKKQAQLTPSQFRNSN